MSSSGISDTEILAAMPEIDLIGDRELRLGTLNCWRNAYEQSEWNSLVPLARVPYNTKVDRATLVAHSASVARIAIAISDQADSYGISTNRDFVIAGSILHDACKLLEMNPDPSDATRAVASEIGTQLAHGVIGGYLARDAGLPLEIQHIIVTHTPQSGMAPRSMDARTVRLADVADANLLFSDAGLGELVHV